VKVYNEQGLTDALAQMRGGQTTGSPPRKQNLKARLAIGGVLILIALFLWRSACSCVSIMCNDKILKELPSPDGQRTARVFVRGCGATVEDARVVELVARRWLIPDASKTVFVEAIRGENPGVSGVSPEVGVRWRGTRDLIVSHHSETGVIRADTKALDVTVTYEKL